MNKVMQRFFLFLILTILLVNCRKKAFDDYYGRPGSLEQPIYQQLTAKGNFKHLLAFIDKAGYKSTLSAAGYWTLFAPNDAAFDKFFQEKGISGIDKVDSAAARAVIQYLLVYNAFTKERIDDYQSNAGWLPDQAFRRRTAYYTGFYNDTMANGQKVRAIQSNRNGSGLPYVAADNNNKYIPYFTDIYFTSKNLTASDYNYFYPSATYSGFNVADAKVLNPNITAENGIVHEIDKVIAPLLSIDEYLRTRSEYSEFKKLFDRYMVSFPFNQAATDRYRILMGKDTSVFTKVYSSLLAFSPNNENYLKLQDNDAQQNGWTLFAPKNDVLLNYVNSVILEHFKTFDNAPAQVIADFLNAHMFLNPVWPSKFSTTFNYLGEEARFDAQTDVFDKKILSNGILYGTNKVQEANIFSSVYAKAYLDPKFSLMTRLLDAELKFNIISPRQKFTLFMMSDAVLTAAGYAFSSNSNTWSYTPPGGTITSGEAIRQRLLRIINTSVVPVELSNLSGTGIAETFNGEFIKWNNNTVISAGTQDANQTVGVDSVKTSKNGKVYYLNGLLTFTDTAIGRHIVKLGGASTATSDYYYFSQYLRNSLLYNTNVGPTLGEILGTSTGTFYTVFAPSNTAIENAVKDGVLPGNTTTGAPNVNPTLAPDKELVSRFILYHILNKRSLIPDGKESGGFETLLKNANGDVLPITIINQVGNMQVTDMNNRKSNVVVAKSNNLSNRTIIHLIDNYLKYTY
jgi:uncharacterized surface protein with fasciclin (FAS1) repeats